MPKGIILRDKDLGPSVYPFILTSAIGTRLYGYSLHFYEPASNDWLKSHSISSKTQIFTPKCICVLSHWPFYNSFRF